MKDKNRFDLFMETSAKSGFNVNNLFCHAGKILYEESVKRSEVNKVRNILNNSLIIKFSNIYSQVQNIIHLLI